jgi:hypothetical protein
MLHADKAGFLTETVPYLPKALLHLRDRPIWVCFEIIQEEDGTKRKIPISPKNFKPAKINDPSTWGTLSEAKLAMTQLSCDRYRRSARPLYLAIALVKDFGLLFIDLDKIRNRETGEIVPWASEIIHLCNSYTEISQSGTGIHILGTGIKEFKGNRKGQLEIYDHGRFCIVTNKPINPDALLEDITYAVDKIAENYKIKEEHHIVKQKISSFTNLSDEEILEKAANAKNRKKFIALFHQGDTSLYDGNNSLADLALVQILAFWTQDHDQIDRLFRRSALNREKWEVRVDYRERTISAALSHLRSTYQSKADAPGIKKVKIHDIFVRPGFLHQTTDRAEEILVSGKYGIFQRAGRLVRIIQATGRDFFSSSTQPKKRFINRHDSSLIIADVEPTYLTELLTKNAKWTKFDARVSKQKQIDCPEKISKTLIARKQWKLPILRGIIQCPTLREDGTILETPGYDERSGLFFDPGDATFDHIPSNPTKEDAMIALERLISPLKDFPFDGKESLSVAVAAILTAIVRKSIPTAPLFAYSSPKMGSGKSLLADIVSYVATGKPNSVIPPAEDEIEERKRLMGVLLDGDPVVCFDNIERPFGSSALCSILTQTEYKDRILGETRTVSIPTNITFLATGNNLTFVGDLSTRVLLCKLDPRCERPEERFFSENLHNYIPQQREVLVSSSITILRAYEIAGRPPQNIKPFGRFEQWSDLIRSSIVWLNMPDPVDSRREIESNDPVRICLGNLYIAWSKAFGNMSVKLKTVISRSEEDENLKEALIEFAPDGRGGINTRTLGKKLSSFRNRIESNLYIEKTGTNQGVDTWRICRADNKNTSN